jgi:hypothetical protein
MHYYGYKYIFGGMKMGIDRNLVYVFGLDSNYDIVQSICFQKEQASNLTMIHEAAMLRMKNPKVEYVYSIRNSFDLYDACCCARRTHSMEDRIVLKVLLDQCGICIA